MTNDTYESICTLAARTLCGSKAWVLTESPRQAVGATWVDILGEVPVSCADVRSMAKEARGEGEVLAVDLTLVRGVGCPALRLGAHLVSFEICEGAYVACVSRDAPQDTTQALNSLQAACDEECALVGERLTTLALEHRKASDVAQVVAHYLACHPKVERVAYPGLKSDPSYRVAAQTLESGFGGVVDYLVLGSCAWERLAYSHDDDPRQEIVRLERSLREVGPA